MKRLVCVVVGLMVITLHHSGLAQQQSFPFDSIAHRFAQTITLQELNEHLTVIASKDFEGRETGKKGQKLAADYIARTFEKEGLPPVIGDSSFFQQYTITETSWEDPYLQVEDKRFNFLENFYTLTSWVNPSEIKFDEIVFAGYGIESEHYNDYHQLEVSGKVVVILSGEPVGEDSIFLATKTKEPSHFTSDFRTELEAKRQMAAKHGAKALLIIDNSFEKNLNRYSRYARMPMTALEVKQPKVTVACIDPSVGMLLLKGKEPSSLARKIHKKEKPVSLTVKRKGVLAFHQEIDRLTGENVLGYLEGSDLKEELIIITAHYDHIGIKDGLVNYGADDDGSGTVAVLEMAEAFAEAKEAGFGPRRSMLFMTVSGEEKGLFGSSYYTENPVFPLRNTVVNLNIDMIGRIDTAHQQAPHYVYVIGSDRLSTELHQINEAANQRYTQLELDYTYNAPDDPNRFYYRSDHYNFAKHNIPVIFYFNGVHADYHKPTDTIEKINFDVLTKRTRLIFFTAWQLANQDRRIEVDVRGK